jgi:CheY-like chemotaxis protein
MSVKSIMVVEDENIIALDIKNRLKNLGFNIIAVVPTGEEAIHLASERKPDLILMDIVLRGNLDGVETAEQISKKTHIPIIFLSSFSDEDTLRKARKVSGYGYLIKPFNEKELKTQIDKINLKQLIFDQDPVPGYSTNHSL